MSLSDSHIAVVIVNPQRCPLVIVIRWLFPVFFPWPIFPVRSIDDGLLALLELRIRSPRVRIRTGIAPFPVNIVARIGDPHRVMPPGVVAGRVIPDRLF